MIIPPKLKKGDKIGIISTARKISLSELNPSIKILENWGLKVVLGNNIFNEYHQFAGNVSDRTNDLQLMIDNKSIKAILCARGGYGTVQIIDNINFLNLLKNPKWIIGYSDVTVLHSHLNTLRIASLHATMPINFSKNTSQALLSLKSAIFGYQNNISTTTHHLNILGQAAGEVIGGNLSILYSLFGTQSDIDTTDKILFIEDLDEYLYHLDRMLISCLRNNKFKKIKALIVGSMRDMNDNAVPFGKSAEEIILHYVKALNVPVCFAFPSGHVDDNRCIKLGVRSLLKINKNGVILKQS